MTGGRWTAEDVRRMLTNPVYAGVGPFPAVVEEEFWITAQEKLIAQEGERRVLMTMRWALVDTFPGRTLSVASRTWAQDSAETIAASGVREFFRSLLAQLRDELQDVTAAETAPVFGYREVARGE